MLLFTKGGKSALFLREVCGEKMYFLKNYIIYNQYETFGK